MRLLLVLSLGLAIAAWGKPKKKPPPAPPPASGPKCEAFDPCLRQLLEAFEGTDYELAQRLAVKLEPLAVSPELQTQYFVVTAALDGQARGLTDEAVRDAVKRKFAAALRQTASLSFTAIPAFARTDQLEELFEAARREFVQSVAPPIVVQPPVIQVVTPSPAPPAPRPSRVPSILFGGLALAGLGVGIGFSAAASNSGAAYRAELDGDRIDAVLAHRWQTATTEAWVGTVGFIGAGVCALAAVIFLLASP